MTIPLRALILHDNASDVQTMLRGLRQAGFDPVAQCVETESEYLAHLGSAADVIFASDSLPGLTASRALQVLHERDLDIPFLVVGDVRLEVVIECIRHGAVDYVPRDRLAHLGETVEGALEEKSRRRLSQNALKASQDYARSIIESSLDMIIAVDRDRKIIEFNRAAEETFGYRREQVLGKSIDILYADPPAGVAINKTTTAKGRLVQEIYNRRKNGEIFPSYLSASVLTDPQGNQIGLMGVSRDISEMKRSEQELKRRADEFSALYEITRDLAAQYDLQALLQAIVDRATNLLSAPGGGIYLYDNERGDLHFEAVRGTHSALTGTRLAIGEGMAGRVAQSRQPLIVDDYRVWQFRSPKFAGIPITAVVEVPMLFRGELIGVLAVYEFDTAKRKFTKADVRLLELFAAHAASAVHIATLFEQVRAGRERLQILSSNLIRAQENERRNIARELHDEIGQELTGIQLNSQAIESSLSDESARALLRDNMRTIEQVLQQVRNLSLDLRPSILDDFGLTAALRWLVNRQAQRAGPAIELKLDSLEERPPTDIETACFRVAQEALTNIMRHANANRVLIELRQSSQELQLVVQDDGIGFNLQTALERGIGSQSMGLVGLKERVVLVGGRIEIRSEPGRGTRVQAVFPMAIPAHYVERRGHRRD
jgi:PAS domain S-box-containing protein